MWGMRKAKDLDACALIDGLGGPAEVSRKTGFTVQRINNWKVRGIPANVKVLFPELFWRAGASGKKARRKATRTAEAA